MILRIIKKLDSHEKKVKEEIKEIISKNFNEYDIDVYYGGQFIIYFKQCGKSVGFTISHIPLWNDKYIRKTKGATHGFTKQEVENIRNKLKEVIALK